MKFLSTLAVAGALCVIAWAGAAEAADLTVTVDVDGLTPGPYDLEPIAALLPGVVSEVRVIPGTVGVIVESE